MRPQRPGSAKTQFTRITQDSEYSKNELNLSKFSQTFSSGVNSLHEKPDDFKQYVKEKDKDPKFKHLKSKLDVIQEKSETIKPNFKPFEKKKQKTVEKTSRKVESKIEKKEEQLRLSRGFAEKNKQKMNSLKTAAATKKDDEKIKQAVNSKINFDSFKVNKPGDKKELKKQTKITIKNKEEQQQKSQNTAQPNNAMSKTTRTGFKKSTKTEQELIREQQMKDLEKYVNEVQARNMDYFPSNYDQAIERVDISKIQDLEKINLNDFMGDPTEEDYSKMAKNIEDLDKQLDEDKIEQSIDLEAVINGESSQQGADTNREDQIYLESLTASELKERNGFITQILAGKISSQDIQKIQDMNKSAMRLHKLEHDKQENEDIQFTQINMVKRQSNRLLERNRIEAAGKLYKDCDYLSEQHKQRLEFLLNNDLQQSPYQFEQLEQLRQRRINEGIRMYRQLAGSEQTPQILDDASLPKDPELKKEAEKKVLREKMSNVNERLSETDKIIVTKAQILSLIKQYQISRTSPAFQTLQEQNKKKIEQQLQKLKQAEELLNNLSSKQNLNSLVEDLQKEYRQLQYELKKVNEIDEQELKRMEKQRLRNKLKEVEEIQKQQQLLQSQIEEIQRLKEQVGQKVRQYEHIEMLQLPKLYCEGYAQGETLDDIDAIITRKYNQTQQ